MSSPLKALIDLCKIDATIFKILAEKKKLETKAQEQKATYEKIANLALQAKRTYESKKKEFEKEESFLKSERQKIATRRKELGSLNNYKVQQVAEKELDHAIREIQIKEDSLIAVVDELDKLEKDFLQKNEKASLFRKELEVFLNDAKETMPTLNERLQAQNSARVGQVNLINPSYFQNYERIRVKYPFDAVVSVDNKGNCSACFMSLGPQILQKILKLESIEHCPGCLRILYISDEAMNELHLNS